MKYCFASFPSWSFKKGLAPFFNNSTIIRALATLHASMSGVTPDYVCALTHRNLFCSVFFEVSHGIIWPSWSAKQRKWSVVRPMLSIALGLPPSFSIIWAPAKFNDIVYSMRAVCPNVFRIVSAPSWLSSSWTCALISARSFSRRRFNLSSYFSLSRICSAQIVLSFETSWNA